MQKAKTPKALYQMALGLLARRDHSTKELVQKLTLLTDFPQIIPEVISRLEEKKYLDDARFAESYSRMRANRGYGKLRIISELREKGISEDFLDSRLDENAMVNIRRVREKKFGLQLPKDMKEKAKQARFLQYKGFTFDEIKKVLENDDDE